MENCKNTKGLKKALGCATSRAAFNGFISHDAKIEFKFDINKN
jgi:hypothetical protein